MYECPNCGGNLKFNIPRQKLYCEYCDTSVEPDSFYKEKDAEEYEATIFTCPQCGGEILSEDTTAATFCSFCGASTILDSRISKKRRPDYIIPFTKTEEECRHAYLRMMRRAIFAPDDLKKESSVEKFRGIYMPYWVYSFEKKGKAAFSGSISYRKGDYEYTKHYRLESDLQAEYGGIAYDASSAFSDNLSAAIAPFELDKGRSFAPAFFSGFYADMDDVDPDTYQSEAEDMVTKDSCREMTKKSACRRYHVDDDDYELEDAVRPDKSETKLAMLPVWFLAYRNGDRVCYAAINGQTGKAAADIPIDFKKYLIGSALLALPVFVLLNLFFTFTPGRLLVLVAALGVLCAVIVNKQVSRLLAREAGADDKGRAFADGVSQVTEEELADAMAGGRESHAEEFHKRATLDRRKRLLLIMLAVVVIPELMLPVLRLMVRVGSGSDIFRLLSWLLALLAVVALVWLFSFLSKGLGISSGKKKTGSEYYSGHWKEKLPTLLKPLAASVLAVLILMLNPVSDWYYYIGAFVCMAAVLWALTDIMKQHNALSTRKLPQFNRRGGDENE